MQRREFLGATAAAALVAAKAASSEAFGRLFAYITGANSGGTLVAMTAPVEMRGKDGTRTLNPEPRMAVPSPEQTKELAKLTEQIAAADKLVKELEGKLDAAQLALAKNEPAKDKELALPLLKAMLADETGEGREKKMDSDPNL